MAGAKSHDYHILPPSIWPLIGSLSALAMASGGIMWMHSAHFGGAVFFAGLIGTYIVLRAGSPASAFSNLYSPATNLTYLKDSKGVLIDSVGPDVEAGVRKSVSSRRRR